MRKNFQEESDELNVDISPMIDCIFILLIFFIVTTVFVEESGVQVNKPEIGGAKDLAKISILIAVTSDGRIMYGGKNHSLQAIGAQVKQILLADPLTPVILQGDTKADHGLVQRVHGQCKTAGAVLINVSSEN